MAKSDAQKEAELRAVGWTPSPGDSVQDAYARTATQADGGNAPNPTPTSAAPSTQPQGFNRDAANMAMQLANNAATAAYNNARLALDSQHYANMDQATKDQLAFDKAKEAWTETFNQAQANIKNQLDTANVTGTFNGAPTLAAQSEQNKTALGYMTLLGSLRGPANAFQYAKTLQGTPQGMTDIVNAAAGRYMLGGNASGVRSAPASLDNMMVDINSRTGGVPAGNMAQQAASVNAVTPSAVPPVNPSGFATADPAQRATYLQYNGNDESVAAAHWAVDVAKAQAEAVARAQAQAQAAAGGTQPGMVGAAQPPPSMIPDVSGLPSPNQINSQAYNRMLPGQRDLLWGAYEYGGGPGGAMTIPDAQAQYAQSLPRYGGPTSGNVNLKI